MYLQLNSLNFDYLITIKLHAIMANTYRQLYVQVIFAVQGRKHLIPKAHKAEVQRYMTGVIQARKHKMIEINCMPDHSHLFIGLHPDQSLSDLIEETKTAATKFIKQQDWMPYKFSWQRGFGAFSYAHSQISAVANYVKNQEEHHRKRTFREEYFDFLQKFEVEYNEKYLFDFYDDVY